MRMLWTVSRPCRLGLAVGSVCALVGLATSCDTVEHPEWVDEDAAVGEGALRDEDMFAKPKGQGGTNGDFDYCDNPASPCLSGEGDCDNDAECSGALVCGQNNGPNYAMPGNYDVCWPVHCENGILDGDETSVDYGGSCSSENCPAEFSSNGDANGFCTIECTCDVGFGDCDGSAQCDDGLICLNNNGSFWGMPPNYDVCVAAHCNNSVQDGDETSVDQGGSCGEPGNCLQDRFYRDSDGDGFGNELDSQLACAGTPPAGFVLDNDDCDDGDSSQFPGAPEVCNGEDDDCDGGVDELATDVGTYYADTDGDSYGDPDSSLVSCGEPSGFVEDNTDCDDTDTNVNPGVTEVCNNGKDDDCDGGSNGCQKVGSIDAASGSFAQFAGQIDDGAGYTMSSGDIDNDGNTDVLIGAPVIPWRLSPALPGRSYLMYGPLTGGNQSLATAADATFSGEVDQDHAAMALSTGDLDNDGNDDIVMGAADHAQATTGGRAYVFYGSGSRFSGNVSMAGADAIIDGIAADMGTGYGGGSGEDASGDAFDDLVIGTPGDLNDGPGGVTGTAYVIHGSASRLSGTNSITAVDSATLNGATIDSSFGNSGTTVGNVGGSATGDIAIGAPGQYWWPAEGDSYAGDVHVFFGPVAGTLSSSSSDVTISGNDPDDWVGVFLMGADIDGDGVNELFVSASGESAVVTEGGKLAIFRGEVPSGGWSISDADITYRAGSDYQYVGEGASVGDFDDDGHADIVLSTWGDGSWLFYGPIRNGNRGIGAADLSITSSLGSAQNEGFPVMFVDDVTGDGIDDLAVGDVGDSSSAGRVYIIAGGGL